MRKQVMRCFWELGYEGASMSALEGAAGIDRRQLARDFGNKRGMFLQALDDFSVRAGDLFLAGMEVEGAGRKAIEATLRKLGDPYKSPVGHLGCLLCNTSREPVLHQDDIVRGKVHAYFERIEAAYLRALRNAHAEGEIRTEPRQLRSVARRLLADHVGLVVLARSQVPTPVLKDAARHAIRTLA
ncbi:MAG: TetR/AcrR family transcriptional regulator [Myxococcota bacterium]